MTSYVIFFWFYEKFHNRFEWNKLPRWVELDTPPNAIKLKLNSYFEIFNYENDVIHDAHKVICNINLQNFGDFGKFGNISTRSILAKKNEIA
jgi:hypothetical protein